MKVLIADDNPDMVGILTTVLTMHGHTVLAAEDGGQAMALMARDCPDVVLLDLMMPNVSGWNFLDSKVASEWAHVPVLILSGWSKIGQPIPDNAGVVGVIEKGSDPQVLLEKLREIERDNS